MDLSPRPDRVTRSDKDAGAAWQAGKSITRVTQAGRVCGSLAISRLFIFILKKISHEEGLKKPFKARSGSKGEFYTSNPRQAKSKG